MRLSSLAIALFSPLILAGCAASSVFNPYPAQAKVWQAALDTGAPPAAIARLQPKTTSADGLLYLLETGRVQQLAGNAEQSQAAFDAALQKFEQQDEKAVISVSSYLASGTSLLTNDNAIPYHGHAYERVFLHQYQALNYLAQGKADGALVEIRRANQVQVDTLAKKENKVDSARADAESKGFDESRYDNYFSPMDLAAGRVKTGFQNAATFYLSGLIYEAAGKSNDAFIDYRKALELVPDNTYLQKDVVRTGIQSGLDVQALAKQLGNTKLAPARNEGELIVYIEEGYVTAKQPLSIPIWTSKTLNTISFPIYSNTPEPHPITVQIDGNALTASVLVDTSALAVRTLKDEVPLLLTRAFLRLLAKQEMQRQMQKNDSTGLLNLFTTMYSLVTDQADLRSWLTLPNSGQVIRLPVQEGAHRVSLPGMTPLTVSVQAGRATLLHLIVLPGRTYSRLYPL
jgi:hypothetical protein